MENSINLWKMMETWKSQDHKNFEDPSMFYQMSFLNPNVKFAEKNKSILEMNKTK